MAIIRKRWSYEEFSAGEWVAAAVTFVLLAIGGAWIAFERNHLVPGLVVLVGSCLLAVWSLIRAGQKPGRR